MSDLVRFLARFAIAALIVVPGIYFWQQTQDNENRAARNAVALNALHHTNAVLAQERIDRTLATCQAANEQRVALIATSQALIRIAVTSSDRPLSAHDHLLLIAFQVKADRQIQLATKPKVCTITALHLQALQGIAASVPPTSAGKKSQIEKPPDFSRKVPPTVRTPSTTASPRAVPPTTVRRRPPPRTTTTTVPCHQPGNSGRCRPKGMAVLPANA